MGKRTVGTALLTVSFWIPTAAARADERLCDASRENCRVPLINLINAETVGIDVGVWFFKDDRFVTALVNAQNRHVPIRIVMDPRANATYPTNGPALEKLKAAGIPMRMRTAGDICHWKLMLFAGQGVVEWSGANYSPAAFVPQTPYKDYEDEVIYFSERLLPSFMTMFDNIWTNTRDYANYANVPVTLVRNYPASTLDSRLNFPPKDSYQDRLVPLINREPSGGWIDVDMYRITMARPVDALINAAARGVRIRLYLEPNEYVNSARPGNKVQMDRLVAAAQQYPGTIEIRMRKHLGLNHQKTIWFHAQHVVVFGTSNWSDASDDNQLEANIFTDKLRGDPLNDFMFDELWKVFDRKWNNLAPDGSIETEPWRTPVLPPPSLGDNCMDPGASNFGQPLPCTYAPPPPPPPPPPPGASTIVVWASRGTPTGNWQALPDSKAAGGTAMWNPNAAKPKVAPALASPANYFETQFSAMSGVAYHVWVRLRSEDDSLANDSVHLQFSDTVAGVGSTVPKFRIGTTSSAEFILQEGPTGAGLNAWGWTDNGWGSPGVNISFETTGTHVVRIQQREDGAMIDQIVLSPDTYIVNPPGPRNNDATILPPTEGDPPPPPPPPPPSAGEILLHPAEATVIVGNWAVRADSTAATGFSLLNTDLGAAKVSPALASPVDYFEMTFDAVAGTPYRLWMRGKATNDSWANDSVYVQFDGTVSADGAANLYRIGTASGAMYSLEDCSNCGVLGWGWQDNGYGAGVSGPVMYFRTTGPQMIRIQPREDGLAIDQIVLSPQTYLVNPPGRDKGDTTILPR